VQCVLCDRLFIVEIFTPQQKIKSRFPIFLTSAVPKMSHKEDCNFSQCCMSEQKPVPGIALNCSCVGHCPLAVVYVIFWEMAALLSLSDNSN